MRSRELGATANRSRLKVSHRCKQTASLREEAAWLQNARESERKGGTRWENERAGQIEWGEGRGERERESTLRCVTSRGGHWPRVQREWRGNKTGTGLWGEEEKRERWSKERRRKGGGTHEERERGEGRRMQVSTVGGVCVQLHRPTTAQLCIRTPLHPTAVIAAAGTLPPVGEPLLLWQSIALSSPSLPSFALRPSTAPSFLLALTPFSLKPSLAPLAARTSRNHRINDVGVTGDAVRAAPVNVTLKTEGVHVHTYSDGCAVRKRASARGAILYIRARDGHWLIRTPNARTRVSLEYLARCEMLDIVEIYSPWGPRQTKLYFSIRFPYSLKYSNFLR